MNRRRFLTGSAGLLLAPAIVRASSLLPAAPLAPPLVMAADLGAAPSISCISILPGALNYVSSTSPVLRAFSYDYEVREYVDLNRFSPRQA